MKRIFITVLGVWAAHTVLLATPVFRTQGQGWSEFGRIMQATDSISAEGRSEAPNNVINFNKTWMQSLGAQFTVYANLGENWDGAFGFGSYQVTNALASSNGSQSPSFLAISLFQNFITQAQATYTHGPKERPNFSFSLGAFPYHYNHEVQNLGSYLLRGPVYPGLLLGGFEDFSTDTSKGNILGARIHHRMGDFTHDLILNNERDLPPTFDWSIAYIAKYTAFKALEVGLGTNFYRLIAYEPDLHTPGKLADALPAENFIEVDTLTKDTTIFTHQGIKLMAMFSLDLKKWISHSSFSESDMKIYGEVGLLGIQDYGKSYGKISERIPVMVGFNMPTFGFLDHLAFEVEYYGAKYRNDMSRLGNPSRVADWTLPLLNIPSPAPTNNSDYGIDAQGNWVNANGDTINVNGTALAKENLTTDDVKWSVHLEKTLHQHIRFTGQIANDHFRPRPIASGFITQDGGTAEAFTSPKDWYFMLRIGFLF